MVSKNNIKYRETGYNNSIKENDEVEFEFEDAQTTCNEFRISEESANDYPMKTIKVEKGFYTSFELKRKYDKGLVILDSDFQRKDVWKLQQKRELIESVLMGLPLPIFYFNEDKNGRLIVIDGRQRITALFEFISEKSKQDDNYGFKLDKLKILSEYNACSFRNLDPILQSRIEDYQIIAYVIQPPTPDRIKFDIFDRVNRAGTQLNKQEIRNALYQGNATQLLNNFAKTELFEMATDKAFVTDKRMKDRYLLLRFIAFYLYFNKQICKDKKPYQYTSDVDELLGLVMEHINSLGEKSLKNLYDDVVFSLEQVNFYMKKNAFRLTEIDENGKIKRYPININIFENIMFAMTLLPYCDENIREITNEKFTEMKKSAEFRETIHNHRDSNTKVDARYNIILKIAGDICDK